MVALWDELKARYPLVIPLGHRDWQDVKPCPGKTASMKAAFTAMGGHGTVYSEVRYMSTRDYTSGQVCTVRDGSKLYDDPGGLAIGTIDPPLVRDYLGHDPSGGYALISSELDGKSRTAWVSAKAVSKVRPVPMPDCCRCGGGRARAGQGSGSGRHRGAVMDRFLAFTTQKEPALTASFLATVLLAIVARYLDLTDEDLAILGPVMLDPGGGRHPDRCVQPCHGRRTARR